MGVGASAGGLEAFTQLLEHLPSDTGMAYVLVQHLDPTHLSLLPSLLARTTKMPVSEASDDMLIEADHVYVIPPNTNMTLEQSVLKLLPRTESGGRHLSIDTFLCSLAANQKSQAIGVILSGTASDGTLGLRAIKAEGGLTFAQDETSAKFHGMPRSAIAAGCVDFIGSPEGIAGELVRISHHAYLRQPNVVGTEETDERVAEHEQEFPEHEREFQKILHLLHRSTNVDFTWYKPTTIKRRILRRMVLQQMENFAEYLAYLQGNAAEVEALYQDMLINVTEFFRDPSIFHALIHDVFPPLMEAKSPGEPFRVWVPGCSTGEEVYSIAICLLEFLAEQSLTSTIQIFGTDLNPRVIEKARIGIYSPSATHNISPARLERFFLKVNGSYQISKSIRDLCVFAQHNVCQDPPFSRLDLLSCQNVLIYLGPVVQKKVVQTFHYALKPHGFLLFGSSETIGNASDLFSHVGKKQKVYMKKVTDAKPSFGAPMNGSREKTRGPRAGGNKMYHEEDSRGFDVQREADRLLLVRYAPASVVIDTDMEIIQFRGHTSPYLEPGPGKASFNLLKMAREGLGLELRTAIHKARKSGHPVKKEGIQVRADGREKLVTVEVIPMKASSTERYFLILFEDDPASSRLPVATMALDEQQSVAVKRGYTDRRIKSLESELAATREDMQSIIEEMEATNEEFQSANEEILSSNEELQSLNEELETSKEEIQSTNEELIIVNQELHQRNEQFQEARDYAEAIVETVREPLLVLQADMRVKTANRAFYQFFQVLPEETEQHILFELENGPWNIPALRTLLEEILPQNHTFMNYQVEHTFPRVGRKTMLLNARRLANDGQRGPLILLAIEDITEEKLAQQVIQEHIDDQKKLMEQQEEFMRIASHELKTPITSVKGYTQLLHRRFTKAGDEQAAILLARMDAQLDKLIRLINELLDVTKIEAGQLPLHDRLFDMDELVREVVEEMGQTTERHQIRVEGDVHTPLFGDRERISQVLTNLLSNAIKYSPQAEIVLVKLSADEEAVTVGVQDFGIGVATEKHEQVFERFFRIRDTEHDTFPGLGLGLYISAEIIKRQRGRIWVESSKGTGSTFFFTLPLRAQQELDNAWEEGEQYA